MLKKITCYLVSRIKGRPFSLDYEVSDSDLAYIIRHHGVGILKGIVRLRSVVSLGRSVKLIGKRKVNLHSGVSIGDYVTLDAIGKGGLRVGKSSSVGAFSILRVSGSLNSLGLGIDIGANVGIGDFSHIGGAGGVKIGDNTIIGAYFSAHPENHNFSDSTISIRTQGVTRLGISIGSDCWIGAKVTVLDGACIGNGCVVAAGAVVRGIFPDRVVIGGVPARILKSR